MQERQWVAEKLRRKGQRRESWWQLGQSLVLSRNIFVLKAAP